jgi:hypothetical protein
MIALFAIALMQQGAPIDAKLAAEYFAEAKAISDADAGKLWQMPVYAPLMFVDASSKYLVANGPDAEGKLQKQGDVYVGKLPDETIVANNDMHWSGTHWTVVKWPLPENRYARRRLVMHEMFHRMQDYLKIPGSDVANRHLAYGDGRILMRLEWRALAEALMREGPARRTAVADALMFRARRRELFKNAATEERLLELNEGLAEYTGFKLSGLPSNVLMDRAAVQLNTYENMENFARSFAYASGPAYGLLLDAGDAKWRSRVSAESDLGEMLRAAYRLAAPKTSMVEPRIAFYEAGRMVREENLRVAERREVEKRLRAKLVDGPTLTFPVGNEFFYGFDPNGAIPLDDLGTAYRSLTVTDEWGALTVDGGGALLLRNDRGVTAVVVAAPPNASDPAKGDGWTLKLREGWRLVPDDRSGSFRIAR